MNCRRVLGAGSAVAVGGCLALCAGGCGSAATPFGALAVMSADLTSGTFAPELTCDGGDRPPMLSWGALEPGARAVAVDLYDPDAPGTTFTHWLLASDQPDLQGQAVSSATPPGFVVGSDDFGVTGYRGPCPPRGAPHHYHLRVRALSSPLHLREGFDATALRQAVASVTVIQSGEVVATYARR